MTNAAALAQLRESLKESAGGYLRNIVRIDGVTCQMCARPVEDESICSKCKWTYLPRGDVADRIGSMIYGIDGKQSGRLMYGYKAAYTRPSHVQTVTSLAVLGLREHRQCADRLVGVPVTKWATVPSLSKAIGVEHPLRTILTGKIRAGNEIEVAAVSREKITSPREVTPSNFDIRTDVPNGAHVMVIDDTWVSGGHAQSVAAALKQAGASKVSVLTVARWVDLADPVSDRFYKKRIHTATYDPAVCPWTGSDCPPP
ncbi:hypothetical protein [Mycolicibacterium vinylchloridicum]|uniref:hypothetical protein n=1 Tax=Mycolicibacterium vinylchloridicum TaxID=2736928 RepID=UPI0015C7D2A7|nr:hypothetical protein [Mycolicibacterium vinylchloridicum]